MNEDDITCEVIDCCNPGLFVMTSDMSDLTVEDDTPEDDQS